MIFFVEYNVIKMSKLVKLVSHHPPAKVAGVGVDVKQRKSVGASP